MRQPACMLTAALLTSFLLCACSTPNNVPPISQDTPSVMYEMAAHYHVCDIAVAVVRNRKLESVNATSDCPPGSTSNPDAIFKAASLGKPVFAYAALQLVNQGKLDLDAPVLNYLPQGYLHLFNPFSTSPEKGEHVSDPRLSKVTVRMVLNHTSGLPNWADGPLTFAFDPGTAWQYSGEGYLLLQRAVENITGLSIDRFITDQVFRPLGMRNSSYIWEDRFQALAVQGHASDGSSRASRRFKSPVVSTTLYTTAADYGRFLAALMNDDHALHLLMNSPVPVDSTLNLSWGLGWGIEKDSDDTLIWHWGNIPGYRSLVVASPSTGTGMVMFTDSDDGLRAGRAIVNTVIPGTHQLFDFRMLQ